MKRGFSLVEALVAVGLFGLMVVVAGGILRDLGQFRRSSSASTKEQNALRALEFVGRRAAAAVEILLPAYSDTATRTELRLLTPALPEDRLATFPLPSSAPPGWSPRLVSGQLRFAVSAAGALEEHRGGSASSLIEQVTFSVQRPQGRLLQLRLSWVDQRGQTQIRDRKVFLPLEDL